MIRVTVVIVEIWTQRKKKLEGGRNMALELRRSERRKSKLRLGISGPAGSGKTYSSLKMAYGISKDWSKVALIDTENGSGDLYADLGEYSVITITAPYTPERYIEAIKLCEAAGMEVVIIDSLSHAWAGEGGLLDQQGKIADNSKSGNSYAAWRTITPKHNALVEKMLATECHVIATLRAKTEYVQEKDQNGKTIIRKVGMQSIQKDGMEYEFTIFFDIGQGHVANATKDRTSLFGDRYFTPNEQIGEELKEWLESGKEPPFKVTKDIIERLISQARKAGHDDAKINSSLDETIPNNRVDSKFNWAALTEEQFKELSLKLS